MKIHILLLLAAIIYSVMGAQAQTNHDTYINGSEGKGQWFISGVYGVGLVESRDDLFNAPDGEAVWIKGGTRPFSKFGLMGGYMGNWGGYARVVFNEHPWTPNVTLGVTKRLYSWQTNRSNALHLNLGFGYGPISTVSKITYVDQGSFEPSYTETLKRNVSEYGTGFIAEGGAILNLGHVNVGLTYALNFDISIEGPGAKPNHTIFLSAGYSF